ncbi:hypothetical protein LCGC14_2232460, partial [marine sediment metagenome]
DRLIAGEVRTEPVVSRPGSRLHLLGLGVATLLVQVALIYGLTTVPSARQWLPFLLPAAHLLLVPFLLRNLSFWGIKLVLVGLLLNLTAMLANGGLMPVEAPAVEAVGRHQVGDLQIGAHIPGSKNVLLNPQDVRLRELSDILVVPIPRPFTRAVSVGDLFVLAGVVITFGEVVRRSEAWKREPSQ